jgi:hypothetical protein
MKASRKGLIISVLVTLVAAIIIMIGVSLLFPGSGGPDYSKSTIDVSVQGPISSVSLDDGSSIEYYRVTVGFMPFGSANQGTAAVKVTPGMTPQEKHAAIVTEASQSAKALGWNNNPLNVVLR